jgi:hypothetical protein
VLTDQPCVAGEFGCVILQTTLTLPVMAALLSLSRTATDFQSISHIVDGGQPPTSAREFAHVRVLLHSALGSAPDCVTPPPISAAPSIIDSNVVDKVELFHDSVRPDGSTFATSARASGFQMCLKVHVPNVSGGGSRRACYCTSGHWSYAHV